MDTPTILIVNGLSWFSSLLVKKILDQKGNVIVVDEFIESKSDILHDLSQYHNFTFIEKNKVDSVEKSYEKIKYIIHLDHENDFDEKKSISSRVFIKESNFIDKILSLAIDKKSKYVLVSNIELNKKAKLKSNYISNEEDHSETTLYELQGFKERSVLEYIEKAGLNGKVIRLGYLYHETMSFHKKDFLYHLLNDVTSKDHIRLYGDGLERMYLIYATDAINGIFKVLFKNPVSQNILYLTNYQEITVLGMANKLLELENRKLKINFLKPKKEIDPLMESSYAIDVNMNDYEWKPKVDFNRGIKIIYEAFKEKVYKEKQLKKRTTPEPIESLEYNLSNLHADSSTPFSPVTTDDKQEKTIRILKGLDEANNTDEDAKRYVDEKEQFPYKTIVVFFCGIILLVFLLVPIIRFTGAYSDANRKLIAINQVVLTEREFNNTSPRFKIDAENSVNDALIGIEWLFTITRTKNVTDNLREIYSGIDETTQLLELYYNGGLQGYLVGESEIDEQYFVLENEAQILTTTIKNQLSNYNKVGLPSSFENKLIVIIEWIEDLEIQMDKIQA